MWQKPKNNEPTKTEGCGITAFRKLHDVNYKNTAQSIMKLERVLKVSLSVSFIVIHNFIIKFYSLYVDRHSEDDNLIKDPF